MNMESTRPRGSRVRSCRYSVSVADSTLWLSRSTRETHDASAADTGELGAERIRPYLDRADGGIS